MVFNRQGRQERQGKPANGAFFSVFLLGVLGGFFCFFLALQFAWSAPPNIAQSSAKASSNRFSSTACSCSESSAGRF